MCVLVVAGRHAVPLVEPAAAACHGVARLVPGRVVGLEPGPGRHAGLNAPPRQPHTDGVAVIGLIRDQAGPQRVDPGLDSSPCAVGVRVAVTRRYRERFQRSVRRWILGAETAPAATERGIRR